MGVEPDGDKRAQSSRGSGSNISYTPITTLTVISYPRGKRATHILQMTLNLKRSNMCSGCQVRGPNGSGPESISFPVARKADPEGWVWSQGARSGLEDMSLEVSGMNDSGREVLELDRGLVAVEEIHAACGDGDRQGSIRIPMTPSLLATQAVTPTPQYPRTHPSSAGTPI